MDGSSLQVDADSATTARELCSKLCEKLKLKDDFGFSLFIALYDKVSSVGSTTDHIMDAISQCKQFTKERGGQEKNAPWKLFYRKEMFSPWHDPSLDEKATRLIYEQVVRGLKFGEYRCDKESDLAMLAAQQYYVECEPELDNNCLGQLLPNYIPTHILETAGDRVLVRWHSLVAEAYQKSYYIQENSPAIKVMEDVVTFARIKWSLLFSKFFEAHRVSEANSTILNLQKGDFILLEDGVTGSNFAESSWSTGRRERTKEEGTFPTEVAYILPALKPPPEEIMELLTKDVIIDKVIEDKFTTAARRKFHTLEEFCKDNFKNC